MGLRVQVLAVALLLCVSLPGVLSDASFWCDGGDNQERLSTPLMELYLSTVTDSWHYDLKWGTEECPCDWFGVNCEGKNATVKLTLENNGIIGSVPPTFCEDVFSTINLSNNSFSGPLPTCFGELTQLKTLRISRNTFQGALPDSLVDLADLKELEVANNQFAGPFPDYLQCPYFFFGDSFKLEIANNSFWCPSPQWCQKKDCSTCMAEPSPACSNQNKAACESDLLCCYQSSWNSACDDLVNKTNIACDLDNSLPEGCDTSYKPPKKEDSTSFWWMLPVGIALIIVLGIGCTATFVITARKRNWSFRKERKNLVKVDSDTYMMDPDDDIYQDEMPPRSSLDYEL